MSKSYKEVIAEIKDAEQRLDDASTEYEWEFISDELALLYAIRDGFEMRHDDEDHDYIIPEDDEVFGV